MAVSVSGTEPGKDPQIAFRQAHAVSWLEETKCQSASFLEAEGDQMLLEASRDAVFRCPLLLVASSLILVFRRIL